MRSFHRAAAPLFAVTLFISAFLLFVIEPIAARMVLPVLGGAPMVWTGCVLFFQCVLLAGYASTHAASAWLGLRRSALVYLICLALPFAFLPFAVPAGAATTAAHPLGWLILALLTTIGAPFFVLAASTSALQQAFAQTRARGSRDPYFLYIASNAGSLIGLLAYPVVIEPTFTLHAQSRLWTMGYAGFVALAAACLVIAWRLPRSLEMPPPGSELTTGPAELTRSRRARWVAMTAIPASLMLGVTGYLTTDIASFPLLWIVPLALYLLTFVAAFWRPEAMRTLAERRLPLGVVVVSVCILLNLGAPVWLILPIHLATFVLAALLCHGALAEDRPPARHLTEFYLWIAAGGVVGGLFNTLAAPALFNGMAEYPIALVLALLFRRNSKAATVSTGALGDIAVPAAVALLTFGCILGIHHLGGPPKAAFLLPAVLCFSQLPRAKRFAWSVAALLLVGSLTPYGTIYGQVLLARRTFFGVYRVSEHPSGLYYALYHGTTLHGLERIEPSRPHEPLTYYHRAGPFGQAFEQLPTAAITPEVAVVGLGIGAVASYVGPIQHWTFFEIDPAVEQLARDGRYFTHLTSCGSRCGVVVGDGRLSMAQSRPGQFGLIVLDAFSSDAIPVHLMTKEAVTVYLSRLAPDGVLMFHISNRHLRLGAVLGRIGADLGLTVLEQLDAHAVDIDERGMTTSDWLVMARRPADLGALAHDSRWLAPPVPASTPLWTDDFSNILSVFDLR